MHTFGGPAPILLSHAVSAGYSCMQGLCCNVCHTCCPRLSADHILIILAILLRCLHESFMNAAALTRQKLGSPLMQHSHIAAVQEAAAGRHLRTRWRVMLQQALLVAGAVVGVSCAVDRAFYGRCIPPHHPATGLMLCWTDVVCAWSVTASKPKGAPGQRRRSCTGGFSCRGSSRSSTC